MEDPNGDKYESREGLPTAYIVDFGNKFKLYFGRIKKIHYKEDEEQSDLLRDTTAAIIEGAPKEIKVKNMNIIGYTLIPVTWGEFSENKNEIYIELGRRVGLGYEFLKFDENPPKEKIKSRMVDHMKRKGSPVRYFKNTYYIDEDDFFYNNDVEIPCWFIGTIIDAEIMGWESPKNFPLISYILTFTEIIRAYPDDEPWDEDIKDYVQKEQPKSFRYKPLKVTEVDCLKLSAFKFHNYSDGVDIFNRKVYKIPADKLQLCRYPVEKPIKDKNIFLAKYQKAYMKILNNLPITKMRRETINNVNVKKTESRYQREYWYAHTYTNKDGTGGTYIDGKMYSELNFEIKFKSSEDAVNIKHTSFLGVKPFKYYGSVKAEKGQIIYVLKSRDKTYYIKAEFYDKINDFIAFVKTRGRGRMFKNKSPADIIKMFEFTYFGDLVRGYFDVEYNSKLLSRFRANFFF